MKVVGAVLNFHKFWDNVIMEIENGTGRMRVVLPRSSCTKCSGAVELRCKCTINSYVRVIGMVTDNFNIKRLNVYLKN